MATKKSRKKVAKKKADNKKTGGDKAGGDKAQKTAKKTADPPKLTEAEVQYGAELIKRAKKIGMSPEMIAVYPDAESLKKACDGISPRTNPDARIKEGIIPPPVEHPDKMPDKFEFESAMEEKFHSANRAQFDENNLQLELRRINRKYGAQKPVKIVKTVNCNSVQGKNKDKQTAKMLITKFEILMK